MNFITFKFKISHASIDWIVLELTAAEHLYNEVTMFGLVSGDRFPCTISNSDANFKEKTNE